MANRRPFNLSDLHPEMRDRASNLIIGVAAVTDLAPFEGYRTPEHQLELYNQRNPVVTQAKDWQSAHQWGLALDFALLDRGEWSWPDSQDPVWDQLHRVARLCGLRVPNPTGDAGHVEHPDWQYARKRLRA